MSVPPFTPLTREDVARILSVSLSKLDQMIEASILPPPRAIGGRRLYWHPDVFYAWLDQHLREDTPAAGTPGGNQNTSIQDHCDAQGLDAVRRKPSTDLSSIQRARARDAARLIDLSK